MSVPVSGAGGGVGGLAALVAIAFLAIPSPAGGAIFPTGGTSATVPAPSAIPSPAHAPRSGADARPAPPDTAVFAGGCFWCMEPPYDEMDGVRATISGYAGGHVENPSYEEVVRGGTGHRESVLVVYDPERVSYDELLYVFWRNVDPLDDAGQFCDRGFSYTTAVFAADEEQAELARASKKEVQRRFEKEVVTPVVTDWEFYPAEEYHQDYYQENPVRYKFYRWNCGRDDRLEELWGDEAGG